MAMFNPLLISPAVVTAAGATAIVVAVGGSAMFYASGLVGPNQSNPPAQPSTVTQLTPADRTIEQTSQTAVADVPVPDPVESADPVLTASVVRPLKITGATLDDKIVVVRMVGALALNPPPTARSAAPKPILLTAVTVLDHSLVAKTDISLARRPQPIRSAGVAVESGTLSVDLGLLNVLASVQVTPMPIALWDVSIQTSSLAAEISAPVWDTLVVAPLPNETTVVQPLFPSADPSISSAVVNTAAVTMPLKMALLSPALPAEPVPASVPVPTPTIVEVVSPKVDPPQSDRPSDRNGSSLIRVEPAPLGNGSSAASNPADAKILHIDKNAIPPGQTLQLSDGVVVEVFRGEAAPANALSNRTIGPRIVTLQPDIEDQAHDPRFIVPGQLDPAQNADNRWRQLPPASDLP